MVIKPWITPYEGKFPEIANDAWVDVSARLIGDITLAAGVSVWPLAVLRADSAAILVESGSVILDLALVEAPEGYPVRIEEECLISHRAVIHGATIERRSLVGIGAIVLDGAVIGAGSIVGAGSLVTAGKVIPPGSLVLGTPGKVIRRIKLEEQNKTFDQVSELYAKSRHMLKQETGFQKI